MKICLIKNMQGALIPASEEDADALKKYKVGATINAEVKQMRNGAFFRKWFKLAKVAYDLWVELSKMPEYKGVEIQPNFKKFRKDLTIMAGYSNIMVNINLEMRAEAQSLAWGSMSEDDFERLYNATINAVLSKVLSGKGVTEARLREMCDAVLDFA